jgi:hypothetical protein
MFYFEALLGRSHEGIKFLLAAMAGGLDILSFFATFFRVKDEKWPLPKSPERLSR